MHLTEPKKWSKLTDIILKGNSHVIISYENHNETNQLHQTSLIIGQADSRFLDPKNLVIKARADTLAHFYYGLKFYCKC